MIRYYDISHQFTTIEQLIATMLCSAGRSIPQNFTFCLFRLNWFKKCVFKRKNFSNKLRVFGLSSINNFLQIQDVSFHSLCSRFEDLEACTEKKETSTQNAMYCLRRRLQLATSKLNNEKSFCLEELFTLFDNFLTCSRSSSFISVTKISDL